MSVNDQEATSPTAAFENKSFGDNQSHVRPFQNKEGKVRGQICLSKGNTSTNDSETLSALTT